MYGAIIGDLAGSIYEYDQIKRVHPIKINHLIEPNSFFSDDTILTMAVADAILNDRNYEKYLKLYIKKYSHYKPNFDPYFKTPFSESIIKWSSGNYQGRSAGNGAVMRISSVGYLFKTEKEVIENAYLATIPTHNIEESVSCATTVALMIFYFRNGLTKEETFKKLNIIPHYTPFKRFNTTCSDTISNCLYALYNSTDFEDAIRNILLMGGDTDTNACIVGSLAEALYGVSDELKSQSLSKLPEEFIKILKKSDKLR